MQQQLNEAMCFSIVRCERRPASRMELAISVLVIAAAPTSGCGRTVPASAESDSAFAAIQARGADARGMGVDQYASEHRFDDAADGGRIEFQMRDVDSSGIAQIRWHLREVAAAFASGDFTTPGFVHDMAPSEVPGASVMASRRATIEYRYADLPRGGEIRIVTIDSSAIAAVHSFLEFQRGDHRAGGHSHGH